MRNRIRVTDAVEPPVLASPHSGLRPGGSDYPWECPGVPHEVSQDGIETREGPRPFITGVTPGRGGRVRVIDPPIGSRRAWVVASSSHCAWVRGSPARQPSECGPERPLGN
jgi:hypothetical protein